MITRGEKQAVNQDPRNWLGRPTIVITASEIPPNERARLRADGWLEKPFRFDTLLDMVRQHVVSEGSGLIAAD